MLLFLVLLLFVCFSEQQQCVADSMQIYVDASSLTGTPRIELTTEFLRSSLGTLVVDIDRNLDPTQVLVELYFERDQAAGAGDLPFVLETAASDDSSALMISVAKTTSLPVVSAASTNGVFDAITSSSLFLFCTALITQHSQASSVAKRAACSQVRWTIENHTFLQFFDEIPGLSC